MGNNLGSKKKIDLSKKLDLSNIDLTNPEIVIKEILSQLPDQTNDIIYGNIESYSGYVESHKKIVPTSIGKILAGEKEITVDVQDSLGANATINKKFECFLYTKIYRLYRYKLFFAEYGISKYPVRLVVEKSIADSLSRCSMDCVFSCNNRDELEDLVCEILMCKRTISVMQEIIRIAQVKEQESATSHDEK